MKMQEKKKKKKIQLKVSIIVLFIVSNCKTKLALKLAYTQCPIMNINDVANFQNKRFISLYMHTVLTLM